MSFHGVDGNVEFFGDFFVFFTLYETEFHDLRATFGEVVDALHDLFDKFFLRGIVGKGVGRIIGKVLLHVSMPDFLMFQVIESPVPGETEQVRKYGTGEVDRVPMVP